MHFVSNIFVNQRETSFKSKQYQSSAHILTPLKQDRLHVQGIFSSKVKINNWFDENKKILVATHLPVAVNVE